MGDNKQSGHGMKRLGRSITEHSKVLTLPPLKHHQTTPLTKGKQEGDSSRRRSRPLSGSHVMELASERASGEGTEVRKVKNLPKLYVLDTNVLMNDWSSLLRFEEHDIYIPLMVIRELDRNKKGHEESAFNSRRTSNFLGDLIETMTKRIPNWKLEDGLALEYAPGGAPGMGRIFIQTEAEARSVADLLPPDMKTNGDDHIIASAERLVNTRGKNYSDVILVSKDFNMRLLTLARGLQQEDYTTDIVTIHADDASYSGMIELPAQLFQNIRQVSPPSRRDAGVYEIDIPEGVMLYPNQMIMGDPANDAHHWIVSTTEGKVAKIRHCMNFISDNKMYGVNARNAEQNHLLNLLMNEEIDIVSILGAAGTGKTLMTMIAAFELVRRGAYNGIIYTRATVPVGTEDIGFLPGDEKDKMGVWAGALADNAEVIIDAMSERIMDPDTDDGHEGGGKKIQKLLEKHSTRRTRSPSTLADISEASPDRDEAIISLLKGIKVKSMGFMRGRSYQNKILIIDEAQNNTPKQLTTLITRAGPKTKVIILGNLDQIDTPYLTASSSGLAHAIDRYMGWQHYGHIKLTRGERSRLADYTVEIMK